MSFQIGQNFAEYSITGILNANPAGRLYKVEHCLTKRIEAMKVLSSELATDSQIKRFEREMRALARLNHPNIAALHNAITWENHLVLLMEYVEGESLQSIFARGRLPLETGIDYIKQVLSALVYAHQQEVVHRDVTPANVVITPDGQAKLTEFGLSKSYGDSLVTTCGEVLGSLPYLAPEQLKGGTQPDRRSDLYSVAAILYEHLTGQKPHGADRRLAAVLTDAESEPLPPSTVDPEVSRKWDPVLLRALARDPARRFQSAQEFLDAIAQLEQRSRVALPLPSMRVAGAGIALVAGAVFAMFASPQFLTYRSTAGLPVRWQQLHIAPPDFALQSTPASTLAAMDSVADDAPAKRTEPAPRPKTAAVITPATVPASSPLDGIKVIRRDPHPALRQPAAPVASSAIKPSFEAPTSDSAVAPPASLSDPTPAQPSATGPQMQDHPQEATPHKKGFWGKLNVFKKRKSEEHESEPSDTQ